MHVPHEPSSTLFALPPCCGGNDGGNCATSSTRPHTLVHVLGPSPVCSNRNPRGRSGGQRQPVGTAPGRRIGGLNIHNDVFLQIMRGDTTTMVS